MFFSIFLAGSILVHSLTKKFSLPYTITIFTLGLIIQWAAKFLPFPVHFILSADSIFFVLLPLLLFESAIHIKFHQFRLQFKTISFISTLGLLFSIFTIGFLLPVLVGIPLPVAMLFGAIISATDPVAVLALFKTLPVPKRLALLVDGESMFNDGTGVIAFKLVSAFVVAGTAFSSSKLAGSFGNFIYVFFGAMALGSVVGFLVSQIIKSVKDDKIAVTTLTIASALGSFVLAEHVFHISGVITTVITGLMIGNLANFNTSYQVRHFMEEVWDYFSFLSNTLVFFFIGYIFNTGAILKNPLFYVLTVLVVLLGRVATTYLSFGITNPLFKDEPSVPLRWQHLINWGGLRATIPILLVFTLPDSYYYKDLLTNMTLATVLFTLLVNGTTTPFILKKLGLHLQKKDEEIIEKELAIFSAEESKEKISKLEKNEFDPSLVKEIQSEILKKEQKEKNELLKLAQPEAFAKSLKRYSLAIERKRLAELLEENRISENAYFQFDTELDLQEDEVEYKEKATDTFNTPNSFRKRLMNARQVANELPLTSKLFGISPEQVTLNRYDLLKARLLTSDDVFNYFEKVKLILKNKNLLNELDKVIATHRGYVKNNREQLIEIEKSNKKLIEDYQRSILKQII